uniref:Uncharacterized protein n=1 Tax=Anguilla anguilla TaxID=7936 RepID=A0A0E9TPL3_ANGAN
MFCYRIKYISYLWYFVLSDRLDKVKGAAEQSYFA